MSRVIKFRAWNKDHGKMHFGSSNLLLDLGGNHYWQFGYDAPMPIPKDEQNCILMQFTGLLDKHGKEIYEGDILCWRDAPEKPLVVQWGSAGWVLFSKLFSRFGLPGGSTCDTMHAFEYARNSEVIGNIHEHPELLK